jgi:hypothetical protein
LRVRTLASPAQFAITLAIGFALAASLILGTGPVRAVATGQKVVVIVGPVGGGSIQTNYLNKGEAIAASAEALGATVVRVFSPNATYAAARAAVNGANIIVYIGHGSGYPNPYSGTLQTAWNNGWGLNAIAGVDATTQQDMATPSVAPILRCSIAAKPRSRASPSPAPCPRASGAPVAGSPLRLASSWSSRTPAMRRVPERPKKSR